jgi:hypothetical protein
MMSSGIIFCILIWTRMGNGNWNGNRSVEHTIARARWNHFEERPASVSMLRFIAMPHG